MSAEEKPRKKIYSFVFTILLAVVGIGAALFVTLRVLDVIMFWSIYSTVFEKVRAVSGFDDYITSIIAVMATAVAAIALPVAIGALLTGNKKKLLIIAGIAVCWFAGMFILSRPREGEYFNRLTGSPQYKYSVREDGKIYLHNIGYNFDPKTGTKLELFTSEVAKKHPEVISSKPRATPIPKQLPPPQVVEIENDRFSVTKRNVAIDGTPAAIVSREPEATPTPHATPTPRPKTLFEVARDAPICEDSSDIHMDARSAPRKDAKLSPTCWSGLIEIETYDVHAPIYSVRYPAIWNVDGNFLCLLGDGRITKGIPEKLERNENGMIYIRLIGQGEARIAVGFTAKEAEELIKTPVYHKNFEQ